MCGKETDFNGFDALSKAREANLAGEIDDDQLREIEARFDAALDEIPIIVEES